MPKTTLNDGQDSQEGLAVKRLKTEPAVEGDVKLEDCADETLRSNFEVDEIFRRVPLHILQEIFGCLDILQAVKKFRVSSLWKSLLTDSALRPTVVFPAGQFLSNEENRKLVEALLHDQGVHSLEKLKRVTHLLCVGASYWERHLEFSEIFPSLTKITLCGDEFDYDIHFWECSPPSVQSAVLVGCSVRFLDSFCLYDSRNEYWRSVVKSALDEWRQAETGRGASTGHCGRPRCCVRWDRLTAIDHLVLLRPDDPQDPEDPQEEEFARLQVLDEKGCIWPYPDVQLQWLLKSLSTLDTRLLQAAKDMDKTWQDHRNDKMSNDLLKKLDLTTEASYDGRKLTSLDLTFFGRLLVFMNSLEVIPGFTPPPYPFIDNLELDCY